MSSAKIIPKNIYKMNFDGCSKGNPGIAGAGAVITCNGEEIWSNYFFVGEKITNNHAEYAGLILGIQQAHHLNIQHLLVEGDSLLVINQMKGIYKCDSPNIIELYITAKELSVYFDNITFNHIMRSNNKRADELANMSIRKYILNKNKE